MSPNPAVKKRARKGRTVTTHKATGGGCKPLPLLREVAALYDEHWAEKQGAALTEWLNHSFHPCLDDAAAAAQPAADAAGSASRGGAAASSAAAGPSHGLRELLAERERAAARRRGVALFRSAEVHTM